MLALSTLFATSQRTEKSRVINSASPLQSHQDSNPNVPASKEVATHSGTVFQPFGRSFESGISKGVLVLVIRILYLTSR